MVNITLLSNDGVWAIFIYNDQTYRIYASDIVYYHNSVWTNTDNITARNEYEPR